MNNDELSEAGKLLVSARRLVDSLCVVCDKPISGTKKRIYCSPVCNMGAYRARKKKSADDQGQ